LLLLNYLLKNGSEKVVTSSREHLYDIRSLETFSYCDENGKDQGINIRVKAKEIAEFVQDDDRLREERKKAKKNKDKYVGINSSGMGSSGGFSSMSSSKSSFSDFSGRNSNWSSSKKDDFTDSNDWKSNSNSSSTIQDRISNITSKVKNIIGEDNNNNNDNNDNDDADDNDVASYNDDLGFENKPSSRKTTESDFKMPANNKKEPKRPPISKTTPKITEDTDDFGDFVTHRIESKATTVKPANAKLATKLTPVIPAPNIDDLLGGFDTMNIQPITATTTSPTLTATAKNDIDQLLSFDNKTSTSTNSNSNNDFDFFGGLMSSSTTTTTIPTSATLPNLTSSNHMNSDFSHFADFNLISSSSSNNSTTNNSMTSPVAKKEQLQQPNKSNTMWDALGTSVDINLDSLSPHSKGSKVTQTNVPMNSLKSQSQSQSPANLFNFAASPAPLSPVSKNSFGMK
jgi:epsin